jgi:hypothetical protein
MTYLRSQCTCTNIDRTYINRDHNSKMSQNVQIKIQFNYSFSSLPLTNLLSHARMHTHTPLARTHACMHAHVQKHEHTPTYQLTGKRQRERLLLHHGDTTSRVLSFVPCWLGRFLQYPLLAGIWIKLNWKDILQSFITEIRYLKIYQDVDWKRTGPLI